LYEQLDGSNEKSKEESLFRRGVQRLRPTLEVLGGSMSLASPLAALDPIANNAFGIIQSVMTVRWFQGYLIDASTDNTCNRLL
jgi:hypothetical protein